LQGYECCCVLSIMGRVCGFVCMSPVWAIGAHVFYLRAMVSLVIMHVQNPDRLAEMRGRLRERMLKSPLMDGARAARDVEEAYRSMWKNFIAGTDGKQKNFVG
jgi:hypothetical protein